jgi:hypothetical protein
LRRSRGWELIAYPLKWITVGPNKKAATKLLHTGPNPTKNRLVKVPKATTPAQAAAERVVPTAADQVMALLDYSDARHPELYALHGDGGHRDAAGRSLRPSGRGSPPRRGTIEVKRTFDPRTGTTRLVDASAQVFAALECVLRARFGDPAQAPADACVLGDAAGHPLNVEWWRRNRGWSQALVAAGEPLAYVQKQLGHGTRT